MDGTGFYNRGLDFYDIGNYVAAIADFTAALQHEPDDGDAFFNRALAKEAIGDPQGAIADWDDVVRLMPDSVEARLNRGAAKGGLEPPDYSGALMDFHAAITLNPYRADAYYNRGTTLLAFAKEVTRQHFGSTARVPLTVGFQMAQRDLAVARFLEELLPHYIILWYATFRTAQGR